MNPDKPKPLTFLLADAGAEALGLTGTQFALLRALVDRYNAVKNGTEVWPSIAYLVRITGFNEKTVRRAKQALQKNEFIKVYSDFGKSDVCSINVDLIRDLADPSQKRQGSSADPSQNREGYPSQNRGGTPPNIGTRIAKGTAKPNNPVPTVGCSANLKVGDGPHQRKMALAGVVAGVSEQMRTVPHETPTEEKPEWQEDRRKAIGAAGGKERPG